MIELVCPECGTEFYRYPSQIGERNFCGRKCLGIWRSRQIGPKAAHWKGGQKEEAERAMWHLPWHPGADSKGYVTRSRIVAELKLGRPLYPEEVVHHEDEDKTNDHPDNLIVFPNQAEHARHHGLKRTERQMEHMRQAKGRK